MCVWEGEQGEVCAVLRWDDGGGGVGVEVGWVEASSPG